MRTMFFANDRTWMISPSMILLVLLACTFGSPFTPTVVPSSKISPSAALHMTEADNSNSYVPIVALNVILRIKPEVREEFLEVILNNQRGTLDKNLEPLALEYSFGEDKAEPNTFHFHEKYLGEDGVAAHNKAPHFLAWEEFAQTDPFTSPPEVYKYVMYDPSG